MTSKSYTPPTFHLPPFRIVARIQSITEVEDYNIKMMNIHAAWTESQGEGVKVAILDTGKPSHPDLVIAGSKSFVPKYLDDRNGHGTHTTGTVGATRGNGIGVVGVAPKAELYTGAVLDGEGSGQFDYIVAGIYWAVDEVKADIISMSLGVAAGTPTIQALLVACNYAKSKGVTVFCAAGNDSAAIGQPARYDSVIAVGAVNSEKEHADFSNIGPELDFCTAGVDVYSTWLNNGYTKLSGSSMSCPALAGVGALIIGAHKKRGEILTPDQVYEHLQRIAYNVDSSEFNKLTGHGIPVFQSDTTGEPVDDNPPVPDPTPKPVVTCTWFQRLMALITGRKC